MPEQDEPGAWIDFAAHRESEQRKFHGRKPKQIGKVLAQLVVRRGYARIRQLGEQEEVWRAVAGETFADLTRFSTIRRGTFEVLVANSLVMQELVFRKEELLERLQEALPEAKIKQLRFKLGSIQEGKS